jgi:DnaJ like chaperone protein
MAKYGDYSSEGNHVEEQADRELSGALILLIGLGIIGVMGWLGSGFYYTAASQWGKVAGFFSVGLGFGLPIISILFWKNVFFGANTCKASEPPSKKSAPFTSSDTISEPNQHLNRFLFLLASMMGQMAKADGRIDTSEIRMAESVFIKLGFGGKEKQICLLAFRDSLTKPLTAVDYGRMMVNMGYSDELRRMAYDVLWDIACADEVLAQEEKQLLEVLESALKLPSGIFHFYFQKRVYKQKQETTSASNSDSLDEAYRELGCSPSNSDEELRKAYLDRVKKLHPDVLRAQGMPEALLGKANQRMARINVAWESIKRARHIV